MGAKWNMTAHFFNDALGRQEDVIYKGVTPNITKKGLVTEVKKDSEFLEMGDMDRFNLSVDMQISDFSAKPDEHKLLTVRGVDYQISKVDTDFPGGTYKLWLIGQNE